MGIHKQYQPRGIRVPPRSAESIRGVALFVRQMFGMAERKVDVLRLLEVELHKINITYEVCDSADMGQDHGLTYPDRGVIQIREDVYLGARGGNPRDRFTICHEVGHLALHPGVSFARAHTEPRIWKPYEDSEWQADTFAAEFMMPIQDVLVCCRDVTDVMDKFGVSHEAAEIRWRTLRKNGFVK